MSTQDSNERGQRMSQAVTQFITKISPATTKKRLFQLVQTNSSDNTGAVNTSDQIKRICILDSSFNPPTRAHEHLVRSVLHHHGGFSDVVLLLSLINADKHTPSGASFAHRLEMMDDMAKDLLSLEEEKEQQRQQHQQQQQQEQALERVSLGLINTPLFLDKAELLRQYFGPTPEIYFLQGMDTVVRVFDPKYYNNLEAAMRFLFEKSKVHVVGFQRSGSVDTQQFLSSNQVARHYTHTYPPNNNDDDDHHHHLHHNQNRHNNNVPYLSFLTFDKPYSDMSSTQARSFVNRTHYDQQLAAIVSPSVLTHISRHLHLYASDNYRKEQKEQKEKKEQKEQKETQRKSSSSRPSESLSSTNKARDTPTDENHLHSSL